MLRQHPQVFIPAQKELHYFNRALDESPDVENYNFTKPMEWYLDFFREAAPGKILGEACPAYLGPAVRAHWGVDDPAHATGTDAEIDAAFERAYRTLRRRIEAFLALPLDALRDDPPRLQAALERIGSTIE